MLLVLCQRPQTFGEGTILAPSRQIGSYRCVLGGCLLLISLSPVLERVDAAGADAPNVAYVDAIRVSASSGRLPAAFRRLCLNRDGVRC